MGYTQHVLCLTHLIMVLVVIYLATVLVPLNLRLILISKLMINTIVKVQIIIFFVLSIDFSNLLPIFQSFLIFLQVIIKHEWPPLLNLVLFV